MNRKNRLTETVLIFYSKVDRCWQAHGLRTDQVGCGNSVLEALTDAIRAIDQVLSVAKDDPTVAYLREAPREIQNKARTAAVLPREIYEIAHRRVRGNWPDNLPVAVSPGSSEMFKAIITEPEVEGAPREMGQRRIKWGPLEKYLLAHGYEIRAAGGDKIIIAPSDGRPRSRQTVRIGHTSCSHAGTEILKCYESKLRNVFKISLNEIDP